jgi:precorrin-6B methylase 2
MNGKVINSYLIHDIAKMKFKNKLLNYMMKKISNYYWYIIDNLAFKLDKFAEIYYKKSIGSQYRMEYQTFNISKNDKVLHIGSGAFPLTEITLAEEIGTTVVGIDKSRKAVESADDVVREKNLQDKIKINLGNGKNYPIKEFDVIIISSCASPMVKIIEHVFKNAKSNSKIIVRAIETSLKPLIESIDLQKNIIFVKKIEHHPFPFLKPFGWQSFYLIKKQ